MRARTAVPATKNFTMWTAADPDTFKVMQITEEQAGKGSQQGKIILTGTTQNVHDYS